MVEIGDSLVGGDAWVIEGGFVESVFVFFLSFFTGLELGIGREVTEGLDFSLS